MIYEEIATGQAEGTYLAHSLKSRSGRLGKGHKITVQDINDLLAENIKQVTSIRMEEGDVHEDQAAAQLGNVISGHGVAPSKAFTGRCNIHSTIHGLLSVIPREIDALNSVDEAITLATLAPYSVVYPGQLVATVKIIPLAASAQTLAVAQQKSRLCAHPFVPHKIGLILTQLPQTKDSVLEKTLNVVNQRLKNCGNKVHTTLKVRHKDLAIANAIKTLKTENHDLVLIFGASAIVDRQDALPSGLVLAGGAITHFGMPVDPGNLLLLGEHSGTAVIGLPGCARSPKLNGFDWVLQRVLAKIPVTKKDITAMGCGGLLSEITTRPQPREKMTSEHIPQRPKITALLLAAGQSRRMGTKNKLLQDWNGKPLVKWVADSLGHSSVNQTIVVTGHEADQVRDCLSELDLEFVHNPDFEDGLSTSLIKGLMAVPADSDAVLICLGDMPSITNKQLNTLINAYDPDNAAAICIPTFEGKRGNPVLWNRDFIPEMMTIKGDSGARHLLGIYAGDVYEVPMSNTAILSDIDTPEALQALRNDPLND
ncbi:NTP transferase domain-containing protein [Kiloniella antarctica]|uniref:NTP transferase domain-containing protein n=1 Tax=Kiloniella antarctica TaxID=1550907 RepID=A0ABW5BF92_9PROT